MSKPLVLSRHAALVLQERGIAPVWLEAAVEHPEWITADPTDTTLTRYFRSTPGHGGRILRVVARELDDHFLIVSVFFDRRARRTP